MPPTSSVSPRQRASVWVVTRQRSSPSAAIAVAVAATDTTKVDGTGSSRK